MIDNLEKNVKAALIQRSVGVASRYVSAGRHDLAAAIYDEILETGVDEPAALGAVLWNMGVSQTCLERWPEAARTFARLMNEGPAELYDMAHKNYRLASSKAFAGVSASVTINTNGMWIGAAPLRPLKGDWLRRWHKEDYVYTDSALCLLLESRVAFPESGRFVFYDVGANVGMFSLYAATMPGADVLVQAFEPNPTAFAEFAVAAEREGVAERVVRHNLAISDTARDGVRLYTPTAEAPDLSRLDGVHPLLANGDWTSFMVNVRRLDDLDLPDPHFMKVDVEDHEYQALIGARGRIARSKPFIFFENWRYGFDFLRTYRPLALLGELGYVLFSPVWRKTVDGHSDWGFAGPKYGEDLNRYRLYLNRIDIETRNDYPENVNVFAIHQDVLPMVERRLAAP
ncbi:MAG TPA: FkbM family methyltransferase [Azospirillaceae bacterium]|nr:FkbM family methyltransferase [Azospirillaceae bacterium]